MSVALVLTIVNGAGKGRVLRIVRPRRLIVGRGDDADWRISDRFVSRHHVLLEICPPACRMRDLGLGSEGSLNAPRLNGKPVRCCNLKDGDILALGLTSLRVTVEILPDHSWSAEPLVPSRPAPERSPREIAEIRCQSCATDLTLAANSDGRAAELRGRVSYVCAACLPRGDASEGKTIWHYELRALLGEGGMGAVYLAYHRATARLVALKRIEDIEDRNAVQRFAREVGILGLLMHPKVVRFVEAGMDEAGSPFVVTEYVPGGNLERLVEREGKLPVPTAVDLVCQILEGLQYLHHRRLIHRDIKPENILLRYPAFGGQPDVVLTDLGIARCYEEAGGTRLTKPNTRMGTLMFMPPEQVQDAGEAREPADIYAAGVTLYFLLTGCYTFEFPSPAQVREFQQKAQAFRSAHQMVREIVRMERVRHPFRIILEEEPVPLLTRAPHLPRRLAAAVDKAVRKEADRRFQTADEFREELSVALR